jgi:hypothetical protein
VIPHTPLRCQASTGPDGGAAQSSVAPLFRVVKKAAARLAGLGPFGLSLSARPPLRWTAMNVAPGGRHQ